MQITTAELARQLGGEITGDGDVVLTGFTSADRARAGDLVFAEKDTYFAAADASEASAILVSSAGTFTSSTKVLIRVPDARVAAARALPVFHPPAAFAPGVDASARIAPTARVDASAHVGPHCVVGENVVIGARSVLMGGNHLGADCRIGDDTRLSPNVVLYARTELGNRVAIHAGTVIGSDGYGYVFDQGKHRNVLVHDDVEIGANAAIDRGALGPTIIGEGTKIDNLVHIAHNVVIGRHCLIMGQVGFAGSTQLGDYGVIASQSGIAGHLKLGRQSVVGAKSGVMRDVGDKETVLGIPAAPDKQAKRQWIAVQKLPELMQRMRDLEKQVAALSAVAVPGTTAEKSAG